MKRSLQMTRWLQRWVGEPRARPATRAERGQALIIIAVAMIGLLAFVGLTVDAGILFIGEGHLRRAVDAAALAAAGQFRVGRTSDQLAQSAKEVVLMNGVNPTTLILGICLAG
jgi:Flp pilus assembly protein TadG